MKTELYTKSLTNAILNEITDYVKTNNGTYDDCKNKINEIIAKKKFAELRPDADIDTQTENTDIIHPVDEISVDTSAGTLMAYIDDNGYGPEIGIIHKTADGTPTDLFSANVVCSDYVQQHEPENINQKKHTCLCV